MRDFVEKTLQNFERPMILAHMGGSAHGPENSRAAITACLKFHPDILEVDVRKSRDGVLFCRHGSVPLGIVFWTLFPALPFSLIRKMLPQVSTLEEIAAMIPENSMLYIDTKDSSINGEDLRRALTHCKGRAIWIAAYSVQHLANIRSELGNNYIFVLNRPTFFLNHALATCENIVDIFQVFIWDYNPATLHKIAGAGYGYHLSRWLITPRKKHEWQLKSNDLWLTYDSLERTHKQPSTKLTSF